MSDAVALPSEVRMLFGATLVLLIGLMWAPAMGASLWIDEAGTYWMISDGLREAVSRSLEFQAQSPAYYVITWLVRHLSETEAILRLPSFLAALGSVWLTYRIGRRLFDRETGTLAATFLASSGAVIFAAADARSYSIALVCLTGSALSLLRWLDDGTRKHAAVFAVLAVTSLYFHYFFGLAIPAFIVYLGRRKGGRSSRLQRWVVATTGAVSILPALIHAAAIMERRDSITVPANLFRGDALQLILPVSVPIGLTVGLLVAVSFSHVTISRTTSPTHSLWLLIPWFVVPSLSLLLLTLGTGAQFGFSRYFLSVAPATALIVAWLLRGISPSRARHIVAVSVVIFLVLGSSNRLQLYYGDENWRGAAETLRKRIGQSDTPVLFNSGLIESQQTDWLTDAFRGSYLTAPASLYRFPGRLIPVPSLLAGPVVSYMDTVVHNLKGLPCIVFIGASRQYIPWLDSKLGPSGYSSREPERFGLLRMLSLERHPGACGGV